MANLTFWAASAYFLAAALVLYRCLWSRQGLGLAEVVVYCVVALAWPVLFILTLGLVAWYRYSAIRISV